MGRYPSPQASGGALDHYRMQDVKAADSILYANASVHAMVSTVLVRISKVRMYAYGKNRIASVYMPVRKSGRSDV